MSNLPELSMRGLHNVSESYIDVAKVIPHISVRSLTQHFPNQNLLPSVAHLPSMETLHSIILLSWFEHSHHRLPGISFFQKSFVKPDNLFYSYRLPHLLWNGV